ncbi:MAG: bifunctional anthranilate synthase component II/anthranilate phosphoribosyltransferase [Lachnospiraceae bacterium]|nr:bifunctional anthranilate synthase component II/anthranilate phosphoribosyltransferase [Lachnospiraceae bacterium]
MILLIDNYDSFSYNLYQLVGTLNPDIRVVRNDKITLPEIEKMNPSHIILSPGPGKPSDAGICKDCVTYFAGKIPILGVCLGHQAIFEAFGGTVSYARQLMHGKQSQVTVDLESAIFRNMNSTIGAARYHSLSGLKETTPDCLKIVASSDDGEIMAVEHREYPIFGLQFHPESILTPDGKKILENFLKIQNYNKKKADGGTLMIKEAIIQLTDKKDLSYQMAESVVDEIMSGETTEVQTSAFLTALAMKGETIEEITGCANGMRKHALQLKHDFPVLEIVGTGGDRSNSFNISTTSSLVISAAGVPVAKHGNRAASSKCGAADVLEALGVDITISVEQSEKLLKDIGICFLFAQKYHTSMKYVGPVRKELGIRTVFNILGPLTNPAGATMQVMGVYSEEMVVPLAHVLSKLGVSRGMVVYGQDGLDEISVSAPTTVCEIRDGDFRSYVITPEQFGLKRYIKEELEGGSPEENARITREILDGAAGAKRDAVLMNAGAALYVAGAVPGIEEGIRLAAEMIDTGKAKERLDQFVRESNRGAA